MKLTKKQLIKFINEVVGEMESENDSEVLTTWNGGEIYLSMQQHTINVNIDGEWGETKVPLKVFIEFAKKLLAYNMHS